MKPKTRPYPYQRECAVEIEQFGGRALIALPPGLGKSLISLLWASWNPEVRPILVVCPAHLKYNWQNECMVHFGWESVVLEGRKSSPMISEAKVWIINYDIVHDWAEEIITLGPKLIIFDEAVALKSPGAKRSRACKAISLQVPHVLPMSGTPITTRPADLWHSLHVCRPDRYRYFRPYGIRYCQPRYTPYGWMYDGAANLQELNRELRRELLVRRKKSDVLPDLPEKVRSVVPLKIIRYKEYAEARDKFLTWLEKHKPEKVQSSIKNQQITQLGYLKRLAAELKLPGVMDWLDERLTQEDKIVLFGIHKHVLGPLRERYKDRCVFVDGGVSAKNRQRAFTAFNQDRKVNLFLGNLQAAGTGWNATVATTVAFCELDWTAVAHEQGEDRGHRIGQKNSLNCVYIVAKDTLEESLCRILQTRQENLLTILDGEVAKAGNLDVFDLLSRELRGQRKGHNQRRRARGS